jgi:SprT protein
MKATVSPAQMSQVNEWLKWGIDVCEKKYGQKFEFPTVLYTLRGRVAGWAQHNTWTINLNSVLLVENFDDFRQTVLHELAHLITGRIHPHTTRSGFRSSFAGSGGKRSVHGPEWQAVMRVLGLEPHRCHSYDTTNSRRQKVGTVQARCKKCGTTYSLGAKRANRLLENPNALWCRCGGKGVGILELIGEVKSAAPAPAKAATTPRAGTKLDACREIYKRYFGYCSRGQIIEMFVEHAGCTPAGAATYWAKLNK